MRGVIIGLGLVGLCVTALIVMQLTATRYQDLPTAEPEPAAMPLGEDSQDAIDRSFEDAFRNLEEAQRELEETAR
jgi:hypothetical protein